MSDINELDIKEVMQCILPSFGDEEIDEECEKEIAELRKVYYKDLRNLRL